METRLPYASLRFVRSWYLTNAGTAMLARIPMIATTIMSSIRVKPARRWARRCIVRLPKRWGSGVGSRAGTPALDPPLESSEDALAGGGVAGTNLVHQRRGAAVPHAGAADRARDAAAGRIE